MFCTNWIPGISVQGFVDAPSGGWVKGTDMMGIV